MKANYAARLKPKTPPEIEEAIRQYFAEDVERAKEEATDLATARMLLISCAALHIDEKDPFGEKRLARYMANVQAFCDWSVAEYDDAALWKALQILETDCPGIDWRKRFGLEVVRG